MSDPTRVTGLLLVAGGVLWSVIVATDLDRTIVVPGVGVAFLLAYLATRRLGLLVPAGILSGLGTGLVIATQGGPEGAIPFGLGGGFAAITAIDAVLGDGELVWWPLIPGGILLVVGGSQIAAIRDVGVYLVPAGLVVVGLLLVLRPPNARQEDQG